MTNISTKPLLSVELWFRVLDLLPVADILALDRVSRAMHDIKKGYFSSTFKLERVISPFLETTTQIHDFVKTMKNTNGFISGSTAIQFFDRSIYPDADLDLYFETKHLNEWKMQLIAFGYRLVPQVPSPKEQESGYPLFEEIELVESYAHQDSGRLIQLMATKGPPIHAVLDFHSTCVMNMLSFDRAYSLYPVSTFIDRDTLVCGPVDDKGVEALTKYHKRGWSTVHEIRPENFQSIPDELKMRTRRLGDDRCWMIDVEEGNKEGRSSPIRDDNVLWNIRLTKYVNTDVFVPRMDFKKK